MDTHTQEPEAMPIVSDHNLTIVSVMHDHGVTQTDLARRSGLSQPTISRVCTGTLAVTPPITQALWAITRDHRIIQVALGLPDAVVLAIPDARDDLTLTRIDQATCIISCHDAATEIARLSHEPTNGQDESGRLRVIDNALGCLLAIRGRLASKETIPYLYQSARRVPVDTTA